MTARGPWGGVTGWVALIAGTTVAVFTYVTAAVASVALALRQSSIGNTAGVVLGGVLSVAPLFGAAACTMAACGPRRPGVPGATGRVMCCLFALSVMVLLICAAAQPF